MADPLHLLILEDRATDFELMVHELRRDGIECVPRRVETESEYRRQLVEFAPGLILADYSLPSYDGQSALALARQSCPEVPFIFVSGTMGEEIAIETLKQGATDYVLKQRLTRLGPSVRRALREAEERHQRRRAEEKLRKLSLQLSHVQDEERRRIARELHDSTGQKLAALSMTVGLLQDAPSAPAGKTEKMFADCLAMIEQCAQEIRTFSYLLHPPLLDELGLAAAIGDYVEGFSKRSGVQVVLDVPPDLERLPDEVELALFRVVQESLGNIHRHAGTPTARIHLVYDAEQVMLEVSDQGRGMSAETLRAIEGGHWSAGVGIAGMRERLRLLGGRLEIESGGQGTLIRAIIPRRQEPT